MSSGHSRRTVPANRSANAFARGDPDRRLDHLRAVPSEGLIEYGGELAIPVADQEPEAARPIAEAQQEVAGLLGGPGPGR